MPFRDTVHTYRLRPEVLKDYLRQLFNQEILVAPAADGKAFYTFIVPRKLHPEEKEHIYEKLRYKQDADTDYW
ncbi:hypothetical protein F4804DRAFT_313836 [Jackrogersella minutella]|nr:hypothetical protein F4804DRAFT_313836 [Jackrogersella minutella]